ncbi:G/T mismatch-specific thymine DNA glycosylase isoform X1 [Paramormyrops kingsleyae]|uniref:G/T mismatch-specific thymine DNA glycosylase isoform X1 n=2 Tax=Paramormyrops kingsleyae TaxID=1676925 RepID=UPI000CD60FAF|nr:G/T mismatch-specific thymine DNA glycosylase-like [Paramormyrops kingsleyae]
MIISTITMEEYNYSPLTIPTDYLQHWYQSAQHVQALQATQYQQMGNAGYFMENSTEDKVMTELAVHQEPPTHQDLSVHCEPAVCPDPPVPATVQRKRGRPSNKMAKSAENQQEKIDESFKKVKRKVDRFNGMSVEEVMAKTLPDVLAYNLDILIVGINPGLMSAYVGHHYPNPGNHFWKCLFMSGLTDAQFNYMHDQTLPEKYGIGFTNMVERTTPGSKDLLSKEFREGGRLLVEKLQKYKPLIAAFNGKCIYEIFSKEIFGIKPKNLDFGLQPHKVPGTETVCYLMPSSSARCAQFPRAQDKVHFYIKLKELRDQIRGLTRKEEVQETQYTFNLNMAKEDAKKMAIKEEQYDPGYDAVNAAFGEEEPEFGPSYALGGSNTAVTASHYQEPASNEVPAVLGHNVGGQWDMVPFPRRL